MNRYNYLYLVNNKETTKEEFSRKLQEHCQVKTSINDFMSISSTDIKLYDKYIREMKQPRSLGISFIDDKKGTWASFRIKRYLRTK